MITDNIERNLFMTEQENNKITSLENASSRELADAIIKILDDRKARDIRLLKLGESNDLTDYFVLCSGTATTQIKGYAGEIEYKLGEMGVKPIHVDGYDTGMWIAMDYATVIVHIFHKTERDFYKLEKLWNDAEEIPLDLKD